MTYDPTLGYDPAITDGSSSGGDTSGTLPDIFPVDPTNGTSLDASNSGASAPFNVGNLISSIFGGAGSAINGIGGSPLGLGAGLLALLSTTAGGRLMDNLTGGAAKANIPGQTPNNATLSDLQAGSLNRSLNLSQLLLPSQLAQLGLTAQTDASGNPTGVTSGNTSATTLPGQFSDFSATLLGNSGAAAGGANSILQGFQNRTNAALSGGLPDNPTLVRQLGQQEEDLRNSLQSQLGSGYETSSAGIRALADFNQRKMETLDASRRADLTTAASGAATFGNQNFNQAVGAGTSSANLRGMTLSDLSNIPASTVNTAGALNAPLSLGQGLQLGTGGLNMQADQTNKLARSSLLASIGGLLGRVYSGSGVGGGIGSTSGGNPLSGLGSAVGSAGSMLGSLFNSGLPGLNNLFGQGLSSLGSSIGGIFGSGGSSIGSAAGDIASIFA